MAPDFGFVGLSSSILVEHIHVLGTSVNKLTTWQPRGSRAAYWWCDQLFTLSTSFNTFVLLGFVVAWFHDPLNMIFPEPGGLTSQHSIEVQDTLEQEDVIYFFATTQFFFLFFFLFCLLSLLLLYFFHLYSLLLLWFDQISKGFVPWLDGFWHFNKVSILFYSILFYKQTWYSPPTHCISQLVPN